MAEELVLQQGHKAEQYQSIIPQIQAIVEGESDVIANLANICAALKQQFDWLWIGFYLVKQNELVLGPFQGPIACSSASRSEIVLPIMKNGECIGVLDIDSEELNQFDEMDAEYLQQLMLMIETIV